MKITSLVAKEAGLGSTGVRFCPAPHAHPLVGDLRSYCVPFERWPSASPSCPCRNWGGGAGLTDSNHLSGSITPPPVFLPLLVWASFTWFSCSSLVFDSCIYFVLKSFSTYTFEIKTAEASHPKHLACKIISS